MSLKDSFLAAQRRMEGDHGDWPMVTNDAAEAHIQSHPSFYDARKKTYDIGFGHKITPAEWSKKEIYGIRFVTANGSYIPLNKKQKETIQQKDMWTHVALARKHGWNRKLKERGLSWDSLDESHQLALQDLAYNVGGEKAGKVWTDIFDAIKNQDTEDFVRQLRRKDAGEHTRGMDNRVAKVAYALGLIDDLTDAHNAGLILARTNEVPRRGGGYNVPAIGVVGGTNPDLISSAGLSGAPIPLPLAKPR